MNDRTTHGDARPARTPTQFLRRLVFVLIAAVVPAILMGLVLPPIFGLLGLSAEVSHALYIVASIVIFTVVIQRHDERDRATGRRG